MKTILHLSDLHFGTEIPKLVELTLHMIKTLDPDFIVISGDLTQRARTSQFSQAREFLNHLDPAKLLCVPGNHDIPLYRILERLFCPYNKYKKFIHPNLNPTYINKQFCIYGLNSVTPYKPMGGFVTAQELENVKKFFANASSEQFKIVVMHHNLVRSRRHHIINDAEKIIQIFAESGVNLVLAGHIHFSYVEQLKRSFISHNMYVVTAGTAISTRTTEPNAFNLIHLDKENKNIQIEIYEYQEKEATFVKHIKHDLTW